MNMRPCSNALFLLLIRSLILCFASTAGKLLMWKFSRGEVAGINGFIQQIVIKLPLCLIQGIGSCPLTQKVFVTFSLFSLLPCLFSLQKLGLMG